MEVVLRDLLRGSCDRAERAQHLAGHEPSEQSREDRHDAERDRGFDLELVQLIHPLLRFREPQELLPGGRLHEADNGSRHVRRHRQLVKIRDRDRIAPGGRCLNPAVPPATEGDARGSADPVGDERIGHRQQRGAADQEQASVQQRQAPPNRRLGVAQPRNDARDGAGTLCAWVQRSHARISHGRVHHAGDRPRGHSGPAQRPISQDDGRHITGA